MTRFDRPCFFIILMIACMSIPAVSAGELSFEVRMECYAGDEPWSVAIRDLDRDGDPDMVTASNDDLRVLLNQGDGTFQAAVGYPAGDNPQAVALGDLDGDDLLDAVVTNRITTHLGGVSILLGPDRPAPVGQDDPRPVAGRRLLRSRAGAGPSQARPAMGFPGQKHVPGHPR